MMFFNSGWFPIVADISLIFCSKSVISFSPCLLVIRPTIFESEDQESKTRLRLILVCQFLDLASLRQSQNRPESRYFVKEELPLGGRVCSASADFCNLFSDSCLFSVIFWCEFCFGVSASVFCSEIS